MCTNCLCIQNHHRYYLHDIYKSNTTVRKLRQIIKPSLFKKNPSYYSINHLFILKLYTMKDYCRAQILPSPNTTQAQSQISTLKPNSIKPKLKKHYPSRKP
ncbi:hypothetical protein V6Z12_A05G054700 [Gossypium hirsutum]